jgi:hypothetical protein
LLKEFREKKPTKKRPHVNGIIISNFFVAKDFYKKDDVCAEANFGRFNSFKCKKSFANASY